VRIDPSAAGRSDVAGDADRLQQVIWNLLSNAIKFTPPAGSIEIGVERTNGFVRIRVSDTGKGISPDFLAHVFDRFRQADSSTTRLHGGLGIGLAIVRHIVEMHGGTVSAASPGPGLGATFVVSLPALERQGLELSPADEEAAEPPPDLTGLRVLMLDDEPDAREVVGEILKSAGATVFPFGSVVDALAGLDEAAPDLIVSDIAMPGGDGYQFLREVRRRRGEVRPVPSIALTAYVRREDRTRALAEGFDRHVSKPIEPERFLRVLAELAGQRDSKAGVAPAPGSNGASSVLVVEDDSAGRDGLGQILALGGFRVQVAHDGESIRKAMEQRPRVALVDLALESLDGYEIGSSLRERVGRDDLVLIAVSGREEEDARRRAFDSGFDAYLVKPVRPGQVERVIQEVSSQRQTA
jgi:CheY-like chemotaxis protein